VWRRRLAALLVMAAAAAGATIGVLELVGGEGAASTTPTPRAPAAEPAPAPSPPPPPTQAAREAVPPDATVSIAAVGDIVMGTGSQLPPADGRTFFDDVDQALRADVVLGNLEGTLSIGGASKCGGGSPNCFAFQTPPAYARWLRKAGFTVLNLANNHAYDYGESGQRQTLRALDRQHLKHTGRPGEIAFQDAGGVRVAVLGFASYPWAQSLLDIRAARQLVRKAADRADVVVVTFHGGAEGSDKTHVPHGTEYFLGENRGSLRAFAHAVVDAGADLVVGHGPHVLRGMEWYRKRLIAYSMGNFGGYGVFSLSGVLSVSGILRVTLHADGTWVRGKLVATRLVGDGVPALDPAEQGHGLVRSLSREDFGRRGMRISETGALRPPV
jgi:hypothetical protein